eukprot:Rmarinus@m.8321
MEFYLIPLDCLLFCFIYDLFASLFIWTNPTYNNMSSSGFCLFKRANSNVFGTDAGRKIAESLKINHSITNLSLCNNDFGEAAALAFSEALAMNDTVTTLSLYGNSISPETTEQLRQAIEDSGRVIDLHI